MTDSSALPPRRNVPRLRSWYAKMLYLIVAFGIWYFVAGLLPTDFSRGVLRSAIAFVLVALATRLFRVKAETNDPREWWRATGRPLAGFLIGSFFVVAVVGLGGVAYTVETSPTRQDYSGEDVFAVISALLCAALAVFYFTSSIRLVGIARAARKEAERK